MAIISICYYVTILLEDSLENLYPEVDTTVTYGYGFYLIASTGSMLWFKSFSIWFYSYLFLGGVVLIGTFFTLILMQTTDFNRIDERCLINRYSDGIDEFDSPTPPPPYSIPPPPYTPWVFLCLFALDTFPNKHKNLYFEKVIII